MRKGCRPIHCGEMTGFICGGEPTDHKCNNNGPGVYGWSDGDSGTLFDKARKEKINLNMCDDDKMYFLNQKDIHFTSGSCSCSICGRAAIDNIYWL